MLGVMPADSAELASLDAQLSMSLTPTPPPGQAALGPGRPLPPGANGFAYQLLGLKPPGGGRHISHAPDQVAQLAER
jgi:cell division protein FtsI (penicillin-binding protein 3)